MSRDSSNKSPIVSCPETDTTAPRVDKKMACRVQGFFVAIWHGCQIESIHRDSVHASRAMTRMSHPMRGQLRPPLGTPP